MSQKVIKIGSSYGVTLRGDLLEAAGLKQGDAVSVALNPKSGAIEIRSAKLDEYSRATAQALELVAKHQEELAKVDEF